MKTAFIGHRRIVKSDIKERLLKAIQTEIEKGCKTFTMGTHGDFDCLALSACRNLRLKYKDIDIEVVLTSLHSLDKPEDCDDIPYSDVKTIMYEIDDTHFKRQITLSNQNMLDECDTLICYVDESAFRSGAKTAMLYAKKRGLNVVNLFLEQDKTFYGKTEEQIDEYMKTEFKLLVSNKKV